MILGLDTETTGIDLATAKIVQLGQMGVSDEFLPTWEDCRLVNPGCSIPPSATEIHHITDEMVAGAPDWASTWRSAGRPHMEVLLGYNIRHYDIPLITRECADADVLFYPRAILDVHDLVGWHFRHLKNRKLAGVAEYLGVQFTGPAHNALNDIKLALGVLRAMQAIGLAPRELPALLKHCAKVSVLVGAEWDRWSWCFFDRGEGVRVGFGKEHFGKLVTETPAGYLSWFINECRGVPIAARELAIGELQRRREGKKA